jgi:hypothetical protein
MFTISAAKLVQAESNQACLDCRGAAEFRSVTQITPQNYIYFFTNPNLKQNKSCLKRYNYKILFVPLTFGRRYSRSKMLK